MKIWDRIQKVLGIGTYSKWEGDKLKYLAARKDSRHIYSELFKGKCEDVDEALASLCDAMDISLDQRYLLQPTDRIIEIYKAVRQSDWVDDLEIERMIIAVEHKFNENPESWFTKEKTVKNWVDLWINIGKVK
jgi:hypothetical protein